MMRHAFINFYIVRLLRDCRTLNLVFWGRSGCLASVEDLFLTRFRDIRERKDAKMLLQYPTFYVLLGDLNEGNARLFKDLYLSLYLVRDNTISLLLFGFLPWVSLEALLFLILAGIGKFFIFCEFSVIFHLQGGWSGTGIGKFYLFCEFSVIFHLSQGGWTTCPCFVPCFGFIFSILLIKFIFCTKKSLINFQLIQTQIPGYYSNYNFR